MKSGSNSANNRSGDLLETLWRLLGCPRGPRPNFGSEKLVRWTPPGPPDGVNFSFFFLMQNSLDFFVWSQLPAAITRSGPGEDGFPRTGRRIDLSSFLFPFGSILGSLFYPFCMRFSFNFFIDFDSISILLHVFWLESGSLLASFWVSFPCVGETLILHTVV